MKIIVLAGGLSTERDVSLSSAAGIAVHYLKKDMMRSFSTYLWDWNMHRKISKMSLRSRITALISSKISAQKNRILTQLKHPARISLTAFSVRMSSSCAALQILLSSAFMAERERMESFRLHSIFLALSIPDRILSDVPLPCTRALQSDLP